MARVVAQPYRSPWMTDDLDELSSLARTFFAREVTPNAERFAERLRDLGLTQTALAERVVLALVRPGDKAVERDRHVAGRIQLGILPV